MSRELERMQKKSTEKVEAVKATLQTYDGVDKHLEQVKKEYGRVAEISAKAPVIIENIDKQFKDKTKLSDEDIAFLFLCTGLQCARQYLLTNDRLRVSAIQGDKLVHDVVGNIVPPTWEKILFQSVPYDAIKTGSHIEATGLAGTTHRFRTLGHDPVLGWVFGTANIMTNSLTKTDFVTTYQVSNNVIIRHYPLGTMGMLERAAGYAKGNPMLLSASVARQAIHFGSDYFTQQGLPIPFLGTLSPELAQRTIYTYRDPAKRAYMDMWSITRGAALAALINQLIAVIHRLFYDENKDGSEAMYEVRTRKILSYSNAMSVGSNVVVSAFTKDLRKLDVGGVLAALHRFISDARFIQEVKRDFLKDEIYKAVVGKPYDFMEDKDVW